MAQTTIQGSFLGDATVTGAKIGADFISAQTALTSGLATTDELIVSDAGVIKRMDISVLEIAATQITASGTLPALNGSNLTALNGTQVTSGTLPADRIADDSIVEAKLDISNGPQNGYYLQTDGSGTLTWAAVSGGVDTTGTPANNQIATFTDADTLQGEASLTFDNAALNFTRNHAGNNSINLTNSTANASASTRLTIQCAGASAGDAVALFHAGGDSYIIGVDNSDSNKFKIAATGGNLGTNDRFIMNTTGVEAIKFSPTQVASADVNTLDDYEEGTFTPTILDNDLNASESQTYLANNNFGTYVKIGRAVFYSLYMRVTSFGNLTTSHHAKIGGLPFATSNNGMARYASVMLDNGALATAGFSVVAELPPNVSYAMLRTWDVTNGTTYTTLNELSSDAALRFTGHYEI